MWPLELLYIPFNGYYLPKYKSSLIIECPFPPATEVEESIPALSLFIKSFKNLTTQTLGRSQPAFPTGLLHLQNDLLCPQARFLILVRSAGCGLTPCSDLFFFDLKERKTNTCDHGHLVSYTKHHKSTSTWCKFTGLQNYAHQNRLPTLE